MTDYPIASDHPIRPFANHNVMVQHSTIRGADAGDGIFAARDIEANTLILDSDFEDNNRSLVNRREHTITRHFAGSLINSAIKPRIFDPNVYPEIHTMDDLKTVVNTDMNMYHQIWQEGANCDILLSRTEESPHPRCRILVTKKIAAGAELLRGYTYLEWLDYGIHDTFTGNLRNLVISYLRQLALGIHEGRDVGLPREEVNQLRFASGTWDL
ncbi:hypothetical protein HDV00_001286 [Rhizophlyctis rosea]|nr:hypothetical protein HDV00_001286 [Rhizophlyctis rosea]